MTCPVDARTVRPSDGVEVADLFTRCECPCHCRWWHFTGTRDEWLERCFTSPETNREELVQDLDRAETSAHPRSVIALPEGSSKVVGWMKISPATQLSKLYGQRPYRMLPSRESDVLAVGCVLIDNDWRGKGVGHALMAAAIRLARERGYRAIEGFPRVEAEQTRPETVWTGPLGIFERAGFDRVHDLGAYPVMRLNLAPPKQEPASSQP